MEGNSSTLSIKEQVKVSAKVNVRQVLLIKLPFLIMLNGRTFYLRQPDIDFNKTGTNESQQKKIKIINHALLTF